MADILEIKDLKGIRSLHVAVLLNDNETEIAWDAPVRFAGAEEVGTEQEEDSTVKYYDNMAALAEEAEGADIYNIICSVVPDKVRAKIDGRIFDEASGSFLGTPKKKPYIALGFIGTDTSNVDHAFWVYKGKMSGGGDTYRTRDDSTDSNGQEYEYTSIYTTHKFKKLANNQPLKFWKYPLAKTSEDAWFASVQTPDTMAAAAATTTE